jgi:Flp pilus assembly pilin Flp
MAGIVVVALTAVGAGFQTSISSLFTTLFANITTASSS